MPLPTMLRDAVEHAVWMAGPASVIGFGLFTLLARRLPPLAALAGTGTAIALAGANLDRWQPDPWHDQVFDATPNLVALWLAYAATCALAALLRPVEPGGRLPERDPVRLARWAAAGIAATLPAAVYLNAIGAGSQGVPYTVLPLVPVLLTLYDSERIRAVRRDLAVLQLGAGVVLACAAWIASLTGAWLFDLLPVVAIAALYIGLGGVTLAAVGPGTLPVAARIGLCGPLAVWVLACVVSTEQDTRTWRQLRGAHVDGLPTATAGRRGLPSPVCLERPGQRCADDVMPLWVWPADQPIRDAIGQRFGWIAFDGPDGLGSVIVGQPRHPVLVTRSADGVDVAGRVVPLDRAPAMIAEARQACGSWGTALDPAIDWTAQEVVSLCEDECAFEAAPRSCDWREDRGWELRCERGDLCNIGPSTFGRCPSGNCTFARVRLPQETTTMRVDCPKGRCTVMASGRPVQLDCRAGGCAVEDSPHLTLRCEGGGCTRIP